MRCQFSSTGDLPFDRIWQALILSRKVRRRRLAGLGLLEGILELQVYEARKHSVGRTPCSISTSWVPHSRCMKFCRLLSCGNPNKTFRWCSGTSRPKPYWVKLIYGYCAGRFRPRTEQPGARSKFWLLTSAQNRLSKLQIVQVNRNDNYLSRSEHMELHTSAHHLIVYPILWLLLKQWLASLLGSLATSIVHPIYFQAAECALAVCSFKPSHKYSPMRSQLQFGC